MSAHHAVEDALVDLRDLEGVDSAEAADVQTVGTFSQAEQTRLEAAVPTADLAPGTHELSVIAADLAGNITVETREFTVGLELDGPDEVALDIHREALADQEALTQDVLGAFALTLGGDEEAAAEAGFELSLAPGTVLVEGEQAVVLRVTDADGAERSQREVTVTVTLRQLTLTDGDITATSTFRLDDALTASITAEDGDRLLAVSNNEHFAALPAVITAPGAEGESVVRVLADGTEIPVAVSIDGGTLSFEGPSKGTYRVLAAADGEGPGDGGDDGTPGDGEPPGGGDDGDGTPGDGKTPGDGDDGTPGEREGTAPGRAGGAGAPGDGSGGHGAGDGTGSGDFARGPLARTGAEAYGLAIAAAVLIAAGTVALVIRRWS